MQGGGAHRIKGWRIGQKTEKMTPQTSVAEKTITQKSIKNKGSKGSLSSGMEINLPSAEEILGDLAMLGQRESGFEGGKLLGGEGGMEEQGEEESALLSVGDRVLILQEDVKRVMARIDQSGEEISKIEPQIGKLTEKSEEIV